MQISLVPNLAVLDYLTATNQLEPEIEGQAKENIRQGITRQLQYQLSDKSFSAFGEQDINGSTWLTAFVYRTFVHVRAAAVGPWLVLARSISVDVLDHLLLLLLSLSLWFWVMRLMSRRQSMFSSTMQSLPTSLASSRRSRRQTGRSQSLDE